MEHYSDFVGPILNANPDPLKSNNGQAALLPHLVAVPQEALHAGLEDGHAAACKTVQLGYDEGASAAAAGCAVQSVDQLVQSRQERLGENRGAGKANVRQISGHIGCILTIFSS